MRQLICIQQLRIGYDDGSETLIRVGSLCTDSEAAPECTCYAECVDIGYKSSRKLKLMKNGVRYQVCPDCRRKTILNDIFWVHEKFFIEVGKKDECENYAIT